MDGWEGGEQRFVNVSYRIVMDRWEEIDNMDIRETTIWGGNEICHAIYCGVKRSEGMKGGRMGEGGGCRKTYS